MPELWRANRLKPAAMIVNSSFYESLGVASGYLDWALLSMLYFK